MCGPLGDLCLVSNFDKLYDAYFWKLQAFLNCIVFHISQSELKLQYLKIWLPAKEKMGRKNAFNGFVEIPATSKFLPNLLMEK